MWRILILLCFPLAGFADERWTSFQSGPFEVFTDAGPKAGRETLVRFEQLRYALGQIVGDDNLTTPRPVRIFVFKNVREASVYPSTAPVLAARDRFAILLTAGSAAPPSVNRETTRLLLETNIARMPESIERGLLAVFSTIEVNGIRPTLGKPVPPAERTHDWALVDMLATDPEYYGKLRVIVYNLRRGIDIEAAYRNAIAKTPAEISKLADQFLAAGKFQTVEVQSRPMSAHDFEERPVEPGAARLALADLLIGDTSRSSYEKMIQGKANVAEAWEGLGLIALHAGQKDAARAHFAKAMEADSKSAGAYIEYARLEPDKAKARAALEKAVKVNPKLAEPHVLMAERETDLDRKIVDLQAAVKLDSRNAASWQALAEAYLTEHDYGDAAKAWRSAEQAATTRSGSRSLPPGARGHRTAAPGLRSRRAPSPGSGKSSARSSELKAEARAQLRATEAKANQGAAPVSGEKPVPWWDGPKPSGRSRGTLKQVDCLGKQLRLLVEIENAKTLRLLIPDASQVTILGGGEQTLGCGKQPPRHVVIEYFPKTNAKLATAGEVATIEFQ